MPDYSVGNAPGGASYAAPLVGFQFGKALSDLPEQYMQGREQSRKIQMEDMFKNGMPTDLGSIMQQGARIGGLPFVQQMLPFLQQLQFSKDIGEGVNRIDRSLYPGGDGTTYAPPGRPSNVPNAAGASNLQPQSQDTSGGQGPLINQVVAESLGSRGPEFSAASIQSLARQLNIDPRSPLNPRQVQQVQRALSRSALPTGTEVGNQEINQPNVENSAAEVNGNAAKSLPVGGVSGGAGPIPGGFQQRFAGQTTPRGPVSPPGVPPGVTEAAALNHEKVGAQYNNLGIQAAAAKNPELAAGLKQKAQAQYDIAKQMREQLGKAYEQPNEEKNLQRGITQRGEELKGEITQGQKELTAINELAQAAAPANDKINLAKSFLNDPNFYSGPVEGWNRKTKQWIATLGGDPSKGTPQEGFQKAVSDLLSEQIRAMAKSGVGRVLMSEVQTMQKSIASLGITPATNRLLLEELSRVHNAQIEISKRANDYVNKHGHLDSGFTQDVLQYYKTNPLFKEKELRDPRMIAPTVMPSDIAGDPVKIKQWAKNNGLKEGDPFAGQDGSGPYRLKITVGLPAGR